MPGEKEKYYIGGKQYIPEESDLLCSVLDGNIFDFCDCMTKRLYMTKKGAFFLIVSKNDNLTVSVLNEKAAFDFMDKNAAYIKTDAYDRIFGIPEQG